MTLENKKALFSADILHTTNIKRRKNKRKEGKMITAKREAKKRARDRLHIKRLKKDVKRRISKRCLFRSKKNKYA